MPPSITHCDTPVELSLGSMTRGQVEQLWARDRATLAKCGLNLETFLAFYDGLARDLRKAAR